MPTAFIDFAYSCKRAAERWASFRGRSLDLDCVSRILVPEIPFQIMTEEKLFTLEKVAESTNSTSYLLVIHSRVYDVTNFISEVIYYGTVVLYEISDH